jgi:hypothetical protein
VDREALDSALLEAHDQNDVETLIRLYTVAADDAELHQDIDAACFFLTYAFVFALESGAPEAATLNQRLAARGRAKLLAF